MKEKPPRKPNKQLPLNINTVIFLGSLRERSQQPRCISSTETQDEVPVVFLLSHGVYFSLSLSCWDAAYTLRTTAFHQKGKIPHLLEAKAVLTAQYLVQEKKSKIFLLFFPFLW